MFNTPLHYIKSLSSNKIFIKREDLIQYSFGGNKARKAHYFFNEIDNKKNKSVITYGSSSSNHCRVIANMAKQRNIVCHIVTPSNNIKTYNSKLVSQLNANIHFSELNAVATTIKELISALDKEGQSPYFIEGGGHGNLGTQAYVDCFLEIKKFEKENNIFFDYIFHASGTGTTQAGLVAGQILHSDFIKKIIGISIAREASRGYGVVLDCLLNYLPTEKQTLLKNLVIFLDEYNCGGYGQKTIEVKNTIQRIFEDTGIHLDPTYTGKAFWGMEQFINANNISNKNILFIHTGSAPLFFDYLNEICE